MRRGRGERGTVTAFVAIMTLALLMTAGLVHDGGDLLTARREAIDVAKAAARAGAQAVDVGALRSRRDTRVDTRRGVAEARRFLRANGYDGTVRVRGDLVEVRVEVRRATTLLALVGLRSVNVSGDGSARIVRGVRKAET